MEQGFPVANAGKVLLDRRDDIGREHYGLDVLSAFTVFCAWSNVQ